MKDIQMVDLKGQYQKIKTEIDTAVINCIESAEFINGSLVKEFQTDLEKYLNVKHVIPCANGTDALQIALMALDLNIGDEVIVPSFTYVATAEAIALLKLKPVMVDVDPLSFNISVEHARKVITNKTKAIVPVHLYGQCADMESIMALSKEFGLFVIEDNAQAIGANYIFKNGKTQKAGTIGHIGTTSFFPSKNLGAYGDGGALTTNDDELAHKIRMIANHGQAKKYYHTMVGCNSRLDTMQAAILKVKLKYIDEYIAKRQWTADFYDRVLPIKSEIQVPNRFLNSTHVFHQYTIQVPKEKRNALQVHLAERGVPSMIYYPLPLFSQEAFKDNNINTSDFKTTIDLCERVISLPIHTETTIEILDYICTSVLDFFK
jgi:dTDP-4-amino-4,6-dideoxygalactose transaminase